MKKWFVLFLCLWTCQSFTQEDFYLCGGGFTWIVDNDSDTALGGGAIQWRGTDGTTMSAMLDAGGSMRLCTQNPPRNPDVSILSRDLLPNARLELVYDCVDSGELDTAQYKHILIEQDDNDTAKIMATVSCGMCDDATPASVSCSDAPVLSLSSSTMSPSTDETPSFLVENIEAGDRISLYTSPDCSGRAKASERSSGEVIELTSSPLEELGIYTFYLEIGSMCYHDISIEYELVDQEPIAAPSFGIVSEWMDSFYDGLFSLFR